MSARCGATATPLPICCEGGRHTRVSIGEFLAMGICNRVTVALDIASTAMDRCIPNSGHLTDVPWFDADGPEPEVAMWRMAGTDALALRRTRKLATAD